MKNILVIVSLMLASVAFATESTTVKQTATGSSVAQAQAGSVSSSAASNQGNSQNITFAAADNSTAAKEAGAADVQVALINSEAAKVIAGTTQTIKNTPSVSGPNLTTSNDTCMGSTSGSFNIAGLGFGGGSSWVDDNCKMLKNSRELWNMGMKAASLALMCNDKANKEALELTGYECPQTTAARKAAEAMKVINGAALKSTDYLTFK